MVYLIFDGDDLYSSNIKPDDCGNLVSLDKLKNRIEDGIQAPCYCKLKHSPPAYETLIDLEMKHCRKCGSSGVIRSVRRVLPDAQVKVADSLIVPMPILNYSFFCQDCDHKESFTF